MSDAVDALARPNRFDIDLGAIARSVQAIRTRVGAGVRVFATLKSNAYGFGLLPVARTVVAAGVDGISLVSLPDAVRLREAGIDLPILLYAGSPFEAPVVDAIVRYRVTPTIHDDESFAALAACVRAPLDIAVKIDAGQERIGVPAERAGELMARVAASGLLRIAIVNTHPYVKGGAHAQACLAWQFERFNAACAEAERLGVRVPLKVLASSKVLNMTGAMNLGGVDPGQALFAGPPGMAAGERDRYQPFAALVSRLMTVKPVTRSEHLGEAPFAPRPGMRMGVMPIGFSDGLNGLNAGHVLVRGRRAPILASPSLEYTRIDLTDVPNAAVGDEIVIIGRQGAERITPHDVMTARGVGRVTDLALEVRPSIPRRYLETAG